MKVRVLEDIVSQTFWNGLATTTVIPQAEVFSALQTKTVDAMELHATGVYAMRLNEVCNYYTELNWQWACGGTVVMSMKTWEALPKQYQDAIMAAGVDMFNAQAEQELYDMELIYGDLRDELGMDVTLLSDEERAEWVAYAKTLNDKFAEQIGKADFEAYLEAVEEGKKMVADGKGYVLEPKDLLPQYLDK
jgi:TRAP-type C4-dicarboxylate transport system substrate-binding protein